MSQDSRAELKAAIAKVDALNKQIANLEAAAERADRAVEQAGVELAKYTGLDKEITAWRVNQVKKGQSTKTLPEKLRAKVDAKRAAGEELEQAESTQEALKDELASLRPSIKPLEEQRVKAAVAVLHEEAGDSLAHEFAEVNAKYTELVRLIRGLANVPLHELPRSGYSVSGPAISGYTKTILEALNGSDGAFPPEGLSGC